MRYAEIRHSDPAYRLIVQKTHGIFQHLIGNQRTYKEENERETHIVMEKPTLLLVITGEDR